MTGRGKARRLTLGWRKLLLGLGCAGLAAGGVCLARGPLANKTALLVAADPAPQSNGAAEIASPSPSNSDYSHRFVASFGDNKEGVTREELGEYLIARFGEKVEHLVNRRIIEDECKAHNIEVTAKEVDEKLAEDLKDLNLDKGRFVKDFLKARGKTLYEWKEDHLRPELMMIKLCRDQLNVSDIEVRNAYEARYGEKVECRIIEWAPSEDTKGPVKKTPEEEARAAEQLAQEANSTYVRIINDEKAFADAALKQKNVALSAGGGQVRAFGRHTLENEALEEQAFALRPGQVSPLLPLKETGGYVVIKCDKRLPADTSVTFEKVRADLAKEVLERKAQKCFQEKFDNLRKNANVVVYLERKASDDHAPYGYVRDAQGGQAMTRNVASLYNGKVMLTREDLGEYLIQRYGAGNVQLLVNRRIIERACQERKLTVSDAEVDLEFNFDCAKHKNKDGTPYTREQFIKEYLAADKVTVFQYKEDILRPRLMLSKLCRDRVHVEPKDFEAAYQAHYGEKVQCRMILWPKDDGNIKFILQEYGQIHDNPKVFEEKARNQASRTLSMNGGLLEEPIGRHTTGNDELEEAAFSLQEGEVSKVIGTPEGMVVLKCEKRIPAQDMDRDQVRDELMREVIEKKTLAEMPLYFKELQQKANPRYLIDDPNRVNDLPAQVEHQLADPKPSH